MLVRQLALVAIGANAFIFSPPPRGSAPLATPMLAPITIKYKIEQASDQEVDLTAVGGNKQLTMVRTALYVTLRLADSSGGRTVDAVLDSIVGDSTSGVTPEQRDSLKGTAFRGYVAASGHLNRLAIKNPNPTSIQQSFAPAMRALFPRLKPRAKVGETWSDTTESNNTIGGGSLAVRTVTNYRADATEQRDGVAAVKVKGAFASSVVGTQDTPSGLANIEGSGNGEGMYYVAADGRYLGGHSAQMSTLTVTGSFTPQPIPVTLKQTTTVTTIH